MAKHLGHGRVGAGPDAAPCLTGTGVYPDLAPDAAACLSHGADDSSGDQLALAERDRTVIKRCLAAPTLRYATAADLAVDLDAHVATQPARDRR